MSYCMFTVCVCVCVCVVPCDTTQQLQMTFDYNNIKEDLVTFFNGCALKIGRTNTHPLSHGQAIVPDCSLYCSTTLSSKNNTAEMCQLM